MNGHNLDLQCVFGINGKTYYSENIDIECIKYHTHHASKNIQRGILVVLLFCDN